MSTGCLILLAAACLNQAAKVPTAAELIKLAPDIRSGVGKPRTIRVDGYLKHPDSLALRYRAAYRASGDFSLVAIDDSDGVPMLYANASEVLFHEPVRPAAIYSKHMKMSLEFGSKDKKIYLNTAVSSHEPATIHIDLASLFSLASAEPFEDQVVVTGDRTYRLSRIYNHGKSTLVCAVDLKQRACPFTSVEMYVEGNPRPVMGLDRIVVDGPVGDDDFPFPDMERLAGLVTVRDDSDAGVFRAVGDLAGIMNSFRARDLAYHPNRRPSGLRSLVRGVDYERVKANDQKFAAAVKATIVEAPRTLPELPPVR